MAGVRIPIVTFFLFFGVFTFFITSGSHKPSSAAHSQNTRTLRKLAAAVGALVPGGAITLCSWSLVISERCFVPNAAVSFLAALR